MPERVLLLRLEGPLQSWGTRARWGVRDTATEPTKSGVMGLLACALGYPVGDPRIEQLDSRLRMGVRIDRPGTVMTDFHTVTDYLPTAGGDYKAAGERRSKNIETLMEKDFKPATILSPRDYLEDASFLVALQPWDENTDLIAELTAALRSPAWPPYLGRKACVPTCPLLETADANFESIEQALERQPVQVSKSRYHQLPEELVLWIEDPAGSIHRQDRIRTNPARIYDFRKVRREVVPAEPLLIIDDAGGHSQ